MSGLYFAILFYLCFSLRHALTWVAGKARLGTLVINFFLKFVWFRLVRVSGYKNNQERVIQKLVIDRIYLLL